MTNMDLTFLDTKDGDKKIALLTLDNERSLNAVDSDMVAFILQCLDDWEHDARIVMVVMRGRGERAFCAGGDIRSLYYALTNKDAQVHVKTDERISEFFIGEYTLNYRMHTYAKPILAWGNGIVMGGGLGLLAGASHKVVTDGTMMAMPEVSIGLFPDAGGSYFLRRMWGKVGLFLGLTGARFFAADAKMVGLGDFAMAQTDFDKLIDAVVKADWADGRHVAHNHGILSKTLHMLNDDCVLPSSQLIEHASYIQALMQAGTLLDVDKALRNCLDDVDCPEFIKTAAQSYAAGSPITQALTWAIYHRVASWSLKDVLMLEYNVALSCCLRGDFAEGVRALLIDKDKNPKWRYHLADIDEAYLEKYFQPIDAACQHPFRQWQSPV